MTPFVVAFSALLIVFVLMMLALHFSRYKKQSVSCCRSDRQEAETENRSCSCGCSCGPSDCDGEG